MRAKITEELVYRLAGELVALGEKPTNTKIRERNGDYGSPNDIAPHLKRWKQEQLEREQKRKEQEQRPIPQHLGELFRPMWDELCREADKGREADQSKHEQELSEKDEEIRELGESLRKADEAREQLRAELEELQRQLQAANDQNATLTEQVNSEASRSETLGQQLQELEQFREKAAFAEGRAEQQQQQIEQLNKRLDTALQAKPNKRKKTPEPKEQTKPAGSTT